MASMGNVKTAADLGGKTAPGQVQAKSAAVRGNSEPAWRKYASGTRLEEAKAVAGKQQSPRLKGEYWKDVEENGVEVDDIDPASLAANGIFNKTNGDDRNGGRMAAFEKASDESNGSDAGDGAQGDYHASSTAEELMDDECGLNRMKLFRIGTSMGPSYFYGAVRRCEITGRCRMTEDKYLPGYLLVDLFGRRKLVASPKELLADLYIFRPRALTTRTWVFHRFANDPHTIARAGDHTDASTGMIKCVLSTRCVDHEVRTGFFSPMMVWMPIFILLAFAGNQMLVIAALVSTPVFAAVTRVCNTPHRYRWCRLILFPLRLAAAIFFLISLASFEELMPMIFVGLSLCLLLIDFCSGDLRIIGSYRFLCHYEIIQELPRRVFVCKRIGADHANEESFMGERDQIEPEVSGVSWNSRMVLLADLNGLICELVRPTEAELEHMLQNYQSTFEPSTFLSLKCFSSDRPTFEALNPELNDAALADMIEQHRKDHPFTWKMLSPSDIKLPDTLTQDPERMQRFMAM